MYQYQIYKSNIINAATRVTISLLSTVFITISTFFAQLIPCIFLIPCVFLISCFFISHSFQTTASAQELLKIKTEPTPEPLPSKESILTSLSLIKEKIESTQKELKAPDLDTESANYRQSTLLNEHLNQLRLIYEQQISLIDEIKPIRDQTEDFFLALNNLDSKEQIKLLPKSFDDIEKLREEISLSKDLSKKIDSRLKNVRLLIDESKSYLDNQEKSRRELVDALPSEIKDNPNSFQVISKDLEVRQAKETLALRRLEVELEKATQKKNVSYLKLLKKRIALSSDSKIFSRTDFQRRLGQIEETEQKLKIEQDQAKEDLEYGEKLFLENKHKIESLSENSASSLDLEKLEAARILKYSAQTRIRLATERLQRLSGLRKLWEARFNNRLKNLDKEQLLPLRENSTVTLERLVREKSLQLSELDETRKKLSQVDDSLSLLEGNSKQAVWIKDHKTALEKLDSAYDESLKSIDYAISVNNNFLSESSEQLGKHSWKRLLQETSTFLSGFWNYELFSSGDYPVTVGKLILGLFLIILGYFASDFLSRILIAKLLAKFKMTQGATAAIQALTFYLLLIAFALAALRIVNVPLTVFTVLGGALAIGVGFGSQNVMNNFISGLIILTEQPIRVGDLIQVESFTGIVKKIGARSTLVRTGNNIDIVVPNSAFLEKNVINWTRSNSQVRLNINVGVDYNSDLELVTECLIAAVIENTKVLPSPKPFVWLTNFGDFSIAFEVNFWANIRSATDRATIESEVRYAIFKLFKEKGVKIPYPHQVLHTDQAIEVKLIGNKNV